MQKCCKEIDEYKKRRKKIHRLQTISIQACCNFGVDIRKRSKFSRNMSTKEFNLLLQFYKHHLFILLSVNKQ